MGFSAVNGYIKEIGLISMLSKRLTCRALALTLLAATLGASVRAAELGEVKVNSHIGQQLSADIELVDLTPADLADLQAKLADPDVFKGANLAMPPVLGGMYISVARRDNKRFLHLTTLQPVNADVLHIFLELNSGGRAAIRAASLWLTPEPAAQRAARSAAVPAAAPLLPSAAAPGTANVAAPSGGGEAGLSEAAQRAFAHRKEVALAQAQAAAAQPPAAAPLPAAVRPAVPAPAMTAPAAPRADTLAAPASTVTAAPSPAPKPHAQKVAPKPAMGGPEASVPPPASCAPVKAVEAQVQQCQAMTSKLADIEGKVQRLQKAMAAPGQAAPARAAAPSAAPSGAGPGELAVPQAKPGAAPSKPGAAPAKPGAPQLKPGVAADLAGNSRNRLVMLVAGTLAGLGAIGGLFYFLRKRQAKGPLKIWQSFRKKSNPEPAEPVLEEVVEVAAQ